MIVQNNVDGGIKDAYVYKLCATVNKDWEKKAYCASEERSKKGESKRKFYEFVQESLLHIRV